MVLVTSLCFQLPTKKSHSLNYQFFKLAISNTTVLQGDDGPGRGSSQRGTTFSFLGLIITTKVVVCGSHSYKDYIIVHEKVTQIEFPSDVLEAGLPNYQKFIT